MSAPWKPGDVAMIQLRHGDRERRAVREDGSCADWSDPISAWRDSEVRAARPLVVIDPEDREQVERIYPPNWDSNSGQIEWLQDHLRTLVAPLAEPSDPKTRVTDSRDNIWRLLADGEWVCTSGPDIGEYLAWSELVKRGAALSEGWSE